MVSFDSVLFVTILKALRQPIDSPGVDEQRHGAVDDAEREQQRQ